MPLEETRPEAPRLVLTDEITARTAEIAEAVGRLAGERYAEKHPALCRDHREQAVLGSLRYEDSDLTLEQVRRLAQITDAEGLSWREREAKNALNAYAALDAFDPADVDALLEMHRLFAEGLMAEAGRFRAGNVGVYQGSMLIHQGVPAREVEGRVRALCEWLRSTNMHPLIRACVFHYELEWIHPFMDGNGPLGRLCQTAILARWQPLFRYLPMEEMLSRRRQGYFNAFIRAENAGECGEFVLFMLEVVRDALSEWTVSGKTEITGKNEKKTGRKSENTAEKKLLDILRAAPACTQDDLAVRMERSPRTVRALMRSLQESGVIWREGARKNGRWVVHEEKAR